MDYRAAARRAAKRYGLDPDIFSRQINQESGFNPNARSSAGAIGIAQIMPETAKGWGVNPRNPVAALNAAAKNMAKYVHDYGGYKNALVAYNAGPGRVGKSLPAETQNYINIILGGKGEPSGTGGGATRRGAAVSVPEGSSTPSVFDVIRRYQAATSGEGTDAASDSIDQLQKSNMDALQRLIEGRRSASSSTSTGGTGGVPSISGRGQADRIAALLAKRFGLSISSGYRSPARNAAVGGAPGSLHTKRRADDLSGSPQNLARAFRYVARKYPGATELFYDPIGYYIKKGKKVKGAIGGHDDHLHIGF